MTYPILHVSDHTPPALVRGLSVRCTRAHAASGVAWVHGALALDVAELTAETQGRWLRALSVVVIGEADAMPRATSAAGDAPLASRVIAALLADGSPAAVLPFSLEIPDAGEACHVHVSAREHTAVCRVGPDAPRLEALPEEPRHLAADQLLLAHDAALAGDDARAVDLFTLALADPSLRADLDRPHLHEAASVACRAALAAEPPRALALLELSMSWLEADRVLRRAALLRLQGLMDAAFGADRARLEAARARVLSGFGLAG